jgi:hypothetical protein
VQCIAPRHEEVPQEMSDGNRDRFKLKHEFIVFQTRTRYAVENEEPTPCLPKQPAPASRFNMVTFLGTGPHLERALGASPQDPTCPVSFLSAIHPCPHPRQDTRGDLATVGFENRSKFVPGRRHTSIARRRNSVELTSRNRIVA